MNYTYKRLYLYSASLGFWRITLLIFFFSMSTQAMQVRQGATAWEAPQTQPLNELGVPSTFHRSFLLNVRLNLPPPEKLLARLEPQSGLYLTRISQRNEP